MRKNNHRLNTSGQPETKRFLALLNQTFNMDELRTLCLELSVDYDNIEGGTKNDKFVSLLFYLIKIRRMEDLITTLQSHRPSVDWPAPEAITVEELPSGDIKAKALIDQRRRQVAGEEIAEALESFTLKVGNKLSLKGTSYLVRKVLVQKQFGSFIVTSARVSDLTLNRNAGIFQIQTTTDTPDERVQLNQFRLRIQNYDKAAEESGNLPKIYDMSDKSLWAVWAVMQWINGQSLAELFPQDGSYPDKGRIRLLLGWAADICDALAELHRQRWAHPCINAHTIVLPQRKRGAVLIDPVFTGQQENVSIEIPRFNPKADLHDLAAVIYQTIAHQPAQARPANDVNPAVPEQLDELVQKGLVRKIRSTHEFKRQLLKIKRTL